MRNSSPSKYIQPKKSKIITKPRTCFSQNKLRYKGIDKIRPRAGKVFQSNTNAPVNTFDQDLSSQTLKDLGKSLLETAERRNKTQDIENLHNQVKKFIR